MNYQNKKELLRNKFLDNIKHGRKVNFTKKTSNLFRAQKINKSSVINVHDFNKVIKIDKKYKTAEVEAMIRFEDLVKETLKHGLLPPVVPQLKTITLGGAVSGVGIEASSFRYGLVHETVLEMEVLLNSGDIVTCSPSNKYSDLFYSIPNSYGTLGYVLKIKIPLIKAMQYVKLQYHKFTDPDEYFNNILKLTASNKFDFIDGVIFDKKLMYIICASFIDRAPYTSSYQYMNIFYKSILNRSEDYLTVSDYIWRWDTDWFWCSKMFYMQNPVLRLILGKFMLGSKSYWKVARFEERHKLQEKIAKLTGTYHKTESVVQDVAIPIENCSRFLDFFHKNIGIKPIWICPTKTYDKKTIYPLFNIKPDKLYIDFGFWDVIQSNQAKGYYNKMIEKEVEKLGGLKSLYSESYYDEKKFWEIYNGSHYQKIKNKYDPIHQSDDLYQKCVLNK